MNYAIVVGDLKDALQVGIGGTPFARLITLFLILVVAGVLLSSGVVKW